MPTISFVVTPNVITTQAMISNGLSVMIGLMAFGEAFAGRASRVTSTRMTATLPTMPRATTRAAVATATAFSIGRSHDGQLSRK